VVATLAMGAVQIGGTALARAPKPSFDGLASMPLLGWLGGLAGATYVTTVFTAIPTIGAAATVGLTVAGQRVASVSSSTITAGSRLPKRRVSMQRLTGVALLLADVVVIKLS
jgi:bacterial/archaeal transporter family-2 protein